MTKMHITKPITALWDWEFDVLMTLGQNKDRFIMQDQSKLYKQLCNCKLQMLACQIVRHWIRNILK